MKVLLFFLELCSLVFISHSALATSRVPSTLAIHCVGAAPSDCSRQGLLEKSHIETISANGKTDQYFVLDGAKNMHCVISKAMAAKQGVSIEFLNEMAARYQVEVTCVYVFPLAADQVSANDFAFRASIR